MAERHYFEDQNCSLFNLDNPAPVPFESWCSCTSPHGYYSCEKLVEALWRPKDGERRIVFKPKCATKLAKVTHWACGLGERTSIVDMPNELLEIILGNLTSFFDVACLAMTCQRLYEVSRKRMEDELEKTLVTSWVGDRLYCLGDLVRAKDQQWNLTKDEVNTLNLQIKNDPKLPFVEHLKNFRDQNFPSRTIPSSTDPDLNLRTFWRTFEQTFSSSTHDVEQLQSLLEINLPTYVNLYKRNTDPYILRNLTTHQYIRGDVFSSIDISDGHDFNPESLCFQLSLMLMTMSCRPQHDEWSNLHKDDRKITYPPDAVLAHRGPWAGMQFDIVALSRVEESYTIKGRQLRDGPWLDVSIYIIAKAQELFMVRGDDRRDYYEKN